jgi:hypothetical protein
VFTLFGLGGSSCIIFPQQTEAAQPKVSDQPLTAEQIAVYRAVLSTWMFGGKEPLNLAIRTDLFPMEGAFDSHECLKDLDLEPTEDNVVHRFRPEDLALLKPANIRLVDRDAQEKEVDENDPGKAIRQGKSIDSALKNGFAHGIAWFSEIRFDKSHTHAVVFYGFRCGSLCGNGGTAILEKANGVWKLKSQCSSWMS